MRVRRGEVKILCHFHDHCAEGGTRTLTRCEPYWILSPARLPIPPLRQISDAWFLIAKPAQIFFPRPAFQEFLPSASLTTRGMAFDQQDSERTIRPRGPFPTSLMPPDSRRYVVREPDINVVPHETHQNIHEPHSPLPAPCPARLPARPTRRRVNRQAGLPIPCPTDQRQLGRRAPLRPMRKIYSFAPAGTTFLLDSCPKKGKHHSIVNVVMSNRRKIA